MRAEIDPNTFAVKIFQDGEDVPFLFQSCYPNNDPFSSVDEATTWANLCIAAYSPDQPYAPQGKGLEGATKPPPDTEPDGDEKTYALIVNGMVTGTMVSDDGVPVDGKTYDKVLPLPDGIIVGASWTQETGFVNP